ncbi:hypothetical protein VNO77_37922 [Canavalia gladiata]|uniref:Uncharacterized protein n=1 Tax=Canavalia gladiata TaxID=3824 RepID=A0AAN9PWA4_CANGL
MVAANLGQTHETKNLQGCSSLKEVKSLQDKYLSRKEGRRFRTPHSRLARQLENTLCVGVLFSLIHMFQLRAMLKPESQSPSNDRHRGRVLGYYMSAKRLATPTEILACSEPYDITLDSLAGDATSEGMCSQLGPGVPGKSRSRSIQKERVSLLGLHYDSYDSLNVEQ